jgi:hypothetical protein
VLEPLPDGERLSLADTATLTAAVDSARARWQTGTEG